MKHLKESILTSIGQGDKYLEEFYKRYGLDLKKIHKNNDGSIDYNDNISFEGIEHIEWFKTQPIVFNNVKGNVSFVGMDIEKIPFKFNKVEGSFDCGSCHKLISLEGCPKIVGRDFCCSNCEQLRSLEGSPTEVKNSFRCINCKKLTSLEGAPQEVGFSFSCSGCDKLLSLKGCPKRVVMFSCDSCYKITSLEGAPQEVLGTFQCRFCDRLMSLKGAPKKIKGAGYIGEFNCMMCNVLTSLEGAPEEIQGDFICNGCEKLISLAGIPKTVGRDFSIRGCGERFDKNDIKSKCNVGGSIRV